MGAAALSAIRNLLVPETPTQPAQPHMSLTVVPSGCLPCPSTLLAVRWDDVLTFELRWSRELHYPDRLIVHRKGTPGWQVGGEGGEVVGERWGGLHQV